EDGIRDWSVTGVETCALPILSDEFSVDSDPPSKAQQSQPRIRRLAALIQIGRAGHRWHSRKRCRSARRAPHRYVLPPDNFPDSKIGRASCRERVEICEDDEY